MNDPPCQRCAKAKVVCVDWEQGENCVWCTLVGEKKRKAPVAKVDRGSPDGEWKFGTMQLDVGMTHGLLGVYEEIKNLRAEVNEEMRLMRREVAGIARGTCRLFWIAEEWWKQAKLERSQKLSDEVVDEVGDRVVELVNEGEPVSVLVAEAILESIAGPFAGPSTPRAPQT